MGKYDDWMRGEDEALLNIVGGVEIARAIFRGEYKLTVEPVVRQEPAAVVLAPLVGTVAKTIRLNPYKTSSVAEAIKLGKYDSYEKGIVTGFADEEVGLGKAVDVDLVEFDRNPSYEDMMSWANGRKPIQATHIFAIGVQHPYEQQGRPIVGLGSVRSGHVLCLSGFGWRCLRRDTLAGGWNRGYLFGFLCE